MPDAVSRKGSSILYASHILGVASLVLEDGGDEEEFIAGLLHDASQDAGVSNDARSESSRATRSNDVRQI